MMNRKIKDRIGQRHGKLLVESYDGMRGHRAMWSCLCDCGNRHVASGTDMASGNTKSCGCQKIELAAKVNLKHGMSKGGKLHGAYASYRGMLGRCYTNSNSEFKRYGGRGIRVCDRWLGPNGFDNFLSDLGERPDGYSIERVDVGADYSPENCKWIPRGDQAKNTRNTVWYLIDGEKMCQMDAAKKLNVGRWVLEGRSKRPEFDKYRLQAVTA